MKWNKLTYKDPDIQVKAKNNNLTHAIMRTVTIEIKNEIALKFLHNLESMHIIRLIESKTTITKQKLSERFAGCISKERANELQTELTQMKRNIL